jgi:ketosteroid isomerase-like protein
MSHENTEIVWAAFDAWWRKDIESMLGLMDADIVVVQAPEMPDGMTRRGHAGVMEAIAAWPEQWDDYRIEIVQVVDGDDRVAVRTHERGRGKSSGVEVEDEIWFVFGFRDGKIAEWRIFGYERDALEALGLAEQDAHADS